MYDCAQYKLDAVFVKRLFIKRKLCPTELLVNELFYYFNLTIERQRDLNILFINHDFHNNCEIVVHEYILYIQVSKVNKDAAGKVVEVECTAEPSDSAEKPKAFIHWVSEPISVEVRLYEPL